MESQRDMASVIITRRVRPDVVQGQAMSQLQFSK